ncbi:MAG: YCF48-related protein [Bacteroidales bacterium]|nr:YCF48-related protein [Bacteroidales bacterium]
MKYFLIVVCILVSFAANAQNTEIIDITPLGFSGNFQYVAYGKDNGIIAIADNNCIYTSKDTCKTWNVQKAPIDSICGLIMAEDQKTGFIYNLYQIYKTVDGGKTWLEHKPNGIPQVIDKRRVEYRNFFVKNIDTLFFIVTNRVNGMRIYMSIDSGDNWTEVAKDMDGNSYFSGIANMCFVTSNHGFAFGTAGFYAETKDGGLTWEKHVISHLTYFYDGVKCSDGTMIQVYDGSVPEVEGIKWAYFPNGGSYKMCTVSPKIIMLDLDGVRITQDMGSTWTLTVLATICNDMIFLSEKIGILVGRDLTSYVTIDGGETWTKYVHEGGEGFNSIYCKNAEECFITGKKGRVFATNDGGRTWNMQDVSNGALYEIEFPTNDVGYIVGPQVLLKTIDGGNTWSNNKIKMMMAKYIDFITEDVGYMGYSNSMPTIQKTTNGGGKWNYVFDDVYDEYKLFGDYYPFSFRNENEGAVCAHNVLLLTFDGGVSWSVACEMPEQTYLQNVLAIGENGWLMFSRNITTSCNYDKFYFCDNELNCSLIFSGEYSSSSGELQKINDTTYRFTYDTLDYISTDEGLTWNPVYTGLKGSKYLVDAHHGYSIYGGQIYKATFGIEELQVSVTKCADRSYELLPQFNGETIPVAIYLKDIEGNLTTIADNVEITNEIPITIDIPENISGKYSIYIESQNNLYKSVETEMIEITKKTPVNVIKENANYRIVGQTIYAFSKDIRLYTITGVEIPIINGVVELQSGIYMLVDGEETYKIVIR